MFHNARLRLTFWYLFIIALISLSFSTIIYRDVANELERGFTIAEQRLRALSIPSTPKYKVKLLLEDELNAAKHVVLLRLFIINGFILITAGLGGYFLAGKTLQPIETMVNDQKRFVADASHELRTPLTSIKTEIEVALREKKLNTKSLQQLLKSNLEEIDKMKKFTDYLLSLSRYEVQGKDLLMERVNLKEIIEEAQKVNSILAKGKHILIDLELEKVEIKGNKASLVELISIFINNAVKYSEKGKSINIRLRKERRNVIIIFKDEGIGIPKQDIPHIFDRFYRADISRNKETTDGFGLGLSIARSIVDAHKGEIKVDSKMNEGSTFTIILPQSS